MVFDGQEGNIHADVAEQGSMSERLCERTIPWVWLRVSEGESA